MAEAGRSVFSADMNPRETTGHSVAVQHQCSATSQALNRRERGGQVRMKGGQGNSTGRAGVALDPPHDGQNLARSLKADVVQTGEFPVGHPTQITKQAVAAP